ncbi:MAG: hypothetical protein KBD01_14800 [Acidobacteria bacterium]|nr:hypothetical protein [Acidobacteriota bacterium]
MIGEPVKAVAVLRRSDGKPLQLKDPQANIPEVAVAIEQVTDKNADPPGKADGARPGDWRLIVSTDRTAEARSLQASVRVATDHPERPEIVLPVRIDVRPAVLATPASLQMFLNAASPAALGRVDFRHGAMKPFRVTEAHVEGELPAATIRMLNPGSSAVQPVEVRIESAGVAPGIYRGKLVAVTDAPRAPKLEVPLTLRVAAAPTPAAPAAAPAPSAQSTTP